MKVNSSRETTTKTFQETIIKYNIWWSQRIPKQELLIWVPGTLQNLPSLRDVKGLGATRVHGVVMNDLQITPMMCIQVLFSKSVKELKIRKQQCSRRYWCDNQENQVQLLVIPLSNLKLLNLEPLVRFLITC